MCKVIVKWKLIYSCLSLLKQCLLIKPLTILKGWRIGTSTGPPHCRSSACSWSCSSPREVWSFQSKDTWVKTRTEAKLIQWSPSNSVLLCETQADPVITKQFSTSTWDTVAYIVYGCVCFSFHASSLMVPTHLYFSSLVSSLCVCSSSCLVMTCSSLTSPISAFTNCSLAYSFVREGHGDTLFVLR